MTASFHAEWNSEKDNFKAGDVILLLSFDTS